MPFITEELWQRLPRRATERAESICVAVYPYEEKVGLTTIDGLLTAFFSIHSTTRRRKRMPSSSGALRLPRSGAKQRQQLIAKPTTSVGNWRTERHRIEKKKK
jgi:valyl-tRNA synthetase